MRGLWLVLCCALLWAQYSVLVDASAVCELSGTLHTIKARPVSNTEASSSRGESAVPLSSAQSNLPGTDASSVVYSGSYVFSTPARTLPVDAEATCGDKIRQPLEQCDGELPGCTAACSIAPGFVCFDPPTDQASSGSTCIDQSEFSSRFDKASRQGLEGCRQQQPSKAFLVQDVMSGMGSCLPSGQKRDPVSLLAGQVAVTASQHMITPKYFHPSPLQP